MRRSVYFVLGLLFAIGAISTFLFEHGAMQRGTFYSFDGMERSVDRMRDLLTDKAREVLREISTVRKKEEEGTAVERGAAAERIAELQQRLQELQDRNEVWQRKKEDGWHVEVVSLASNVFSLFMAVLSCYFTWLAYRMQRSAKS
jgi:hypothetical protein